MFAGLKYVLSNVLVYVHPIHIIQSTAKFYGKDNRHTTVLANERANLPLRLTGDGVSYMSAIFELQLTQLIPTLAMANKIP